MSQECRLANARLTSQKVDSAFGKPGSQKPIELTDAGGEGIARLGGESGFNRKAFGGLNGHFLTRLGLGRFEEGGGFDQSIPFVAGRTLAGPLGELIATTIAKKDGRRFHILYCTFYILHWDVRRLPSTRPLRRVF